MPAYYKLGDDGWFHDEDYATYWEDDQKYPYLIFYKDEKAGFALVDDKDSERVLAQFFVLYKFQGMGVARSAERSLKLSPERLAIQAPLSCPH